MQEALGDKTNANKSWSQNGDPECRETYKECKEKCKRVIAIAKAEATQEWYDKLNTIRIDGATEVYL